MTTAPNHRNGGVWGTGPTLWSTATHRYAVIINLDWSVTAWRQTISTGAWESFDLSTVTDNPLSLPFDSGAQADTHYRMAICRDNSGIVHVTGNMHNDGLRYVVCTDEDDWTNSDSWEDGTSRLPDLTETGEDYYSYGTFRPAPDGTVVWMFHQQDSETVNGRDTLMFQMGPAASSWTSFVSGSDGELLIVPEDEDEETTPGRVYTSGFKFDPDGTFHLFGLWQMETFDSTTRSDLFYIRRTSAGVWETISGDPVTMPLEYATAVAADDCILPDQLPYVNQNWNIGLDSDGYPHINVQSSAPNRRHHWWDGSAWQYENTSSFGHFVSIHSDLWTERSTTTGRIKLYGPNSEVVVMSGDVSNNFDPQPDPVSDLAGFYSVLAPYGDTPRVFTYGNGARGSAA